LTAQKLSALLNAAGDLQSLTAQAKYLAALQQTYTMIAPAELLAASRVGYLKAGTLFLVAENGAVAAKLKQLTPTLFAGFQKRRAEITGIRVEVQVGAGKAANPLKKNKHPSETGLSQMRSLANKLEDSPLKQALDAVLARHRKPL
jgi:hypothetical protein